MTVFIIRRLLQSIAVVLVMSFIVFVGVPLPFAAAAAAALWASLPLEDPGILPTPPVRTVLVTLAPFAPSAI